MCDLMASDKSPDFVEKLTHKYKQKCKIESSTDSESETNAEGDHKKNRMEFAEGIIREFLDPYDGDSEDIPNLSDSSLNNCSLGDMSCSGVSNSLNSHVLEDVTIEDSTFVRGSELANSTFVRGSELANSTFVRGSELANSTFVKGSELARSSSWTLPALETNDVYMQPMSELKLPVEILSQELKDCSARFAEPSDLSEDSRIITEVQGPRLEHSWFMNIDPPKPVRLMDNTARVPLQPTRLIYDKDIKLYKPPLFKRKLELPHSECEKTKRKKQHLA